jgi:hypothetical protein
MSTLAATNLKNASSGSNNIVLNTDGTTTLTPSNIIKSGTSVASTSGVSIDFTGIPSWVKRVTVMFNGVSTSGTSSKLVQLGAGSITTSGYSSTACQFNPNAGSFGSGSSTAGMMVWGLQAADLVSGTMTLTLVSSNAWTATVVYKQSTVLIGYGGGDVTLSGTLDRVRITTVNGTDTFDAGSINILYEG